MALKTALYALKTYRLTGFCCARHKLPMSRSSHTPDFEHSHAPEDIAKRLNAGPPASYLRDWVLGGIDGAVTTFAIVAGVAGASLSTKIILILGAANLLADGFSMAAGTYSGVKAEKDDYERLHEMEMRHIQFAPEGEKEEIRQIFRAKGFSGDELERAVDIITSNKDRWVKLMLEEEHGMPKQNRSPMIAACVTFSAFFICGSVPLSPYFFAAGHYANIAATVMTGAVFLGIGALKSKSSTASWRRSALETFVIGISAAAFAYLTGALLKQWVGV